MKCKFLSDDFNAVCTNADCDCVADFCPCVNWPQICRHSEDVDEGTTSSVWPEGQPPSPKGEGLEGADDG